MTTLGNGGGGLGSGEGGGGWKKLSRNVEPHSEASC